MKKKRLTQGLFMIVGIGVLILPLLICGTPGWADSQPVAEVVVRSHQIDFLPKISGYSEIILKVSAPGGYVLTKTFNAGNIPYFEPSSAMGDGTYIYELSATPGGEKKVRKLEKDIVRAGMQPGLKNFSRSMVQSGVFSIRGGSLVTPFIPENGVTNPMDVINDDDMIITGSICVGFDCVDGETFGYDTIKLKENNLRLYFEDTSNTSSFPANDWRLVANDTANGGANYFSIEDSTAGNKIFMVKAGAPAHSLYVDDYGRVGLGTSVPSTELHLLDGDSPTCRLEQDTSEGWGAQVWDILGNETNFFIRDVTNGSQTPFRIQPGAPTNNLCLKSDGKVGIGTWSPAYKVEVQTTGENCALVVNRTDGAINYVNATATYANFGSVNNFPTRIMANGTWRLTLNTDNSLSMVSGASCTTGGVWTNASSIELKENISSLSSTEAQATLEALNPVKFNYKADKDENHVGFIAEEVPELVASKDRKGMSAMDVVAILTRVMQEQQKTIAGLKQEIAELKKK